MWFKILSLLVGVPCLLKGIVGLCFPDRFYRWRQGQYSSERPPAVLYLGALSLSLVVAITWYATVVHYASWGWLVTAAITFAAVLAGVNLATWRSHQIRALRAVHSPAIRRVVDLALIVIGATFTTLAIRVY